MRKIYLILSFALMFSCLFQTGALAATRTCEIQTGTYMQEETINSKRTDAFNKAKTQRRSSSAIVSAKVLAKKAYKINGKSYEFKIKRLKSKKETYYGLDKRSQKNYADWGTAFIIDRYRHEELLGQYECTFPEIKGYRMFSIKENSPEPKPSKKITKTREPYAVNQYFKQTYDLAKTKNVTGSISKSIKGKYLTITYKITAKESEVMKLLESKYRSATLQKKTMTGKANTVTYVTVKYVKK